MKSLFVKNIILFVAVVLGLLWWQRDNVDDFGQDKSQAQEQIAGSLRSIRNSIKGESKPIVRQRDNVLSVSQAQKENLNKVQVVGQGVVVRTLPDDNKGSRHQRFIVRTDMGTVLVVHNVDLAPRLNGLRAGDVVAFSGEFISNERGGIVHWTHHDPNHYHADGWLLYGERRYQ